MPGISRRASIMTLPPLPYSNDTLPGENVQMNGDHPMPYRGASQSSADGCYYNVAGAGEYLTITCLTGHERTVS